MAFKFGLRDCKIATWNDTGSYGTPVDVPINQIELTPETTSGRLELDDVIKDTQAFEVGGRVRVRWGRSSEDAVGMDVLAVITGNTPVSSDANRKITMGTATGKFPYFGLVGVVKETGNADSEEHLFVAKLKVMNGVPYRAAYGGYLIDEFEAELVPDGDYGTHEIYEFATATTVALPPTF